MSHKAVYFLKKSLGEDIFDDLQKTELYKPNTRSVTSLEDIHHGLKLVPRAMMALLVRELVPMKVSEHKDIELPVEGGGKLHVEKLGPDVYSGHIEQENKKTAEFSHRPIPGVALVVMSTFELYEEREEEAPPQLQPGQTQLGQQLIGSVQEATIQAMIDNRLELHSLINRVVDKKMEQKDAVQQLMMARLTHAMAPAPAQLPPEPVEPEPEIVIVDQKRELPLRDFLTKRAEKLKKNEFYISLEKHDKVSCSDCGKEIFNSTGFSGCICFGENMKSKVSIKKSEHGVKISFGRGWDPENLQMLLEVLRSRRG